MNPLKNSDIEDLSLELTTARPPLGPAIELATMLHEGQTRRAPRSGRPRLPYIEHPLRVAARLQRAGVTDEALLTAALLHDTVEDCSHRFNSVNGRPPTPAQALGQLEEQFGPTVSRAVKHVTLLEEGHYAANVHRGISRDTRSLLIKASDWIDNAGSLHHHPTTPFRLVAKYMPLTPVLLENLHVQEKQADHLLNGNLDEVRRKVVRVGDRLLELSRLPHLDPSATP